MQELNSVEMNDSCLDHLDKILDDNNIINEQDIKNNFNQTSVMGFGIGYSMAGIGLITASALGVGIVASPVVILGALATGAVVGTVVGIEIAKNTKKNNVEDPKNTQPKADGVKSLENKNLFNFFDLCSNSGGIAGK
jgi:hypothetical protein